MHQRHAKAPLSGAAVVAFFEDKTLPYFVASLLVILLSLSGLAIKRSYTTTYSLIIIVFLSLFVANRDVNVGQDTINYVAMFHDIDRYVDFVEPGFVAFNKVASLFVSADVSYLFLLALSINALLLVSYRLIIGRYALLALAVFVCTHFFWVFQVQVIRNGLSASMFLLASLLAVKRRALPCAIAAVCSIAFHYTAALPVAILAALYYVDFRSLDRRAFVTYGMLAVLIILTGGLIEDLLLANFGTYYSKFSIHTQLSEIGETPQTSVSFFYMPTALLIFLTIRNWCSVDETYKRLFAVYSALLITSLSFWSVLIFRDRLFYYAQPLEPLMLVYLMLIGADRRRKLALLLLGAIAWSIGVVFVWGRANIITFY